MSQNKPIDLAAMVERLATVSVRLRAVAENRRQAAWKDSDADRQLRAAIRESSEP